MQDRDYYRAMTLVKIMRTAQEGINPEMAIALADRLAVCYAPHLEGSFHFNHKENSK